MIQQGQTVLWMVVIAYMTIMLLAGSYYARYMRTADAYFKAGNLVPWWAAGISMYMANFTAYTFVGIASLVYVDGLVGILLESGPALAFLVAAVVFSKRWHRLNLTSPPEYLEARFNPFTRRLFSMLGIALTFLGSGIRLYAMCKFVESVTGLPLTATILVAGAVIVIYTMLGGLWAVIVTDVLQFVVLFLAVIPLFVISVAHVFLDASYADFIARIPLGFGSFPHPEHGRTLGWLLAWWLTYLLDYNGDWGVIQRMCCTPTEADARKAALLSMALSIPHAVLLLGPCFIARVLWAGEIADPAVMSQAETVYGRIAVKLLPAGLVGVVAAAMFSATMSTLSVSWSVRSTSFVNDLYVRFMRPQAGDREQILAGRLAVLAMGAVATVVAVVIALTSAGLFALGQALVGFMVIPLVLPLLLGLLLRRTHNWAGLAGLSVCLGFTALSRWGYRLLGLSAPLTFGQEIVGSTILALLVMLGSGLLTRDPVDAGRVRDFFGRMASPRRVEPSDRGIPPPVTIIGSFVSLIGLLVLALCAMPQASLDRIVTLLAAAALVGIGTAMRRRRTKAHN
ncbi:MAG: hypothetical protein AAB225_24450 [Acidobacteriota bacterium]